MLGMDFLQGEKIMLSKFSTIPILLSVFITFRYFLEVELLDYMVVGLNFLRIFHKISIVTAPINNPTNQCTHPFLCIHTSILSSLIMVILKGVWCYSTVVLVCISLNA